MVNRNCVLVRYLFDDQPNLWTEQLWHAKVGKLSLVERYSRAGKQKVDNELVMEDQLPTLVADGEPQVDSRFGFHWKSS